MAGKLEARGRGAVGEQHPRHVQLVAAADGGREEQQEGQVEAVGPLAPLVAGHCGAAVQSRVEDPTACFSGFFVKLFDSGLLTECRYFLTRDAVRYLADHYRL